MYATLEEAWGTPLEMRQKKKSTKSMKRVLEESDVGSYVNARAKTREDFTNGGGLQLSTAPKDSYAGRLNDYTFGCKQYGVCPRTLKQNIEGFANPKQKPLTRIKAKCPPVSPRTYKYPMSEKEKRKFKKVMEAALHEGYESSDDEDTYDDDDVAIDARTSRLVDMSKVDGYVDDDLDQYLSIDNMKDQISNPPTATPRAKAEAPYPNAYDPDNSPFAMLMREAAARNKNKKTQMWDITREPRCHEQSQEQGRNVNVQIARPPMWMDLVLFILIGVVIILMMDQLFRLAMVSGMKQTLEMLKPLLQDQYEI